jgi:hypothetical protein
MQVIGEILGKLDGVVAVRVAPLSHLIRDVTDWPTPVGSTAS